MLTSNNPKINLRLGAGKTYGVIKKFGLCATQLNNITIKVKIFIFIKRAEGGFARFFIKFYKNKSIVTLKNSTN